MKTHTELNKCYTEQWKKQIFSKPCSPLDPDLRFFEYVAIQKPVVELLLNICKQFDMTNEIYFAAVDNFDIFFIKHIQTIISDIEEKSDSDSEEELPHPLHEKYINAIPIYILCVIQIVSKVHDKNLALSLTAIIYYLDEVFEKYVNEELLTISEFYVFSKLDFTVSF